MVHLLGEITSAALLLGVAWALWCGLSLLARRFGVLLGIACLVALLAD